MHSVKFSPSNKSVRVRDGITLLEAAQKAGITVDTGCGGEGICGSCGMRIIEGTVADRVCWPFTRKQVEEGWVLACMSRVNGNLTVEIPGKLHGKLRKARLAEEPTETAGLSTDESNYKTLPIVTKTFIQLERPTLFTGQADHQLVSDAVKKQLDIPALQTGLKIIKNLPEVLRNNNYKLTVTVGLRRDIAEIMNIEGGDTESSNYMLIVDIGTTTIVAHLVKTDSRTTVDQAACYNSQSVHGSEITSRMIFAERKNIKSLQKLLVDDINRLIELLCGRNNIPIDDINAVVAAGNTAMSHFLLDLSTANIRRKPFIPVTVEPPPLRASEVGLKINRRGLLYSLPGISGWVGSDLTAGILAVQMNKKKELGLLIDIGTNGEVILGNRDWLVATSASAGPALEGASVECGMRAEPGAVDKVYSDSGVIRFTTIDDKPPLGICGSGIIDLLSILLNEKIINRSGLLIDEDRTEEADEYRNRRFILSGGNSGEEEIYLTEKDIENIITAKAAIFAAITIMMRRLSLKFSDIENFYIAGAFGRYINIENAINIGLLPPLPAEKFIFAGNTSVKGAKLAAFYQDAYRELTEIRGAATYYDLLGAEDYVEEFRKAMFLPHTDIDYWRAIR